MSELGPVTAPDRRTAPTPDSIDVLYPLAEHRAGYFTTAQAAEVGVSRQQLSYLARTGSLERVAKGMYRLHRFPARRFEDVIVACLWAGDDAVASHDTALAVYELTDAMPAEVHQRLLARLVVVAATGSWALKGGQAPLARLESAARSTNAPCPAPHREVPRTRTRRRQPLDLVAADEPLASSWRPLLVSEAGTHPAHWDADSWA